MYNHGEIDGKWQKKWSDAKIFEAKNDTSLEKYYLLVEFPYPSGAGLHVGHPRSYTALDVLARKRRMEGKNVLFPMGWDAFGLPAENYAIKTGVHPSIVTKENIATFRRQLQSIGFSFDWSREVDTTDPKYYRWTQWMFLEFFKQGLCYKAKMPINWCPKDKIGLANEEAAGGVCERCGTPVEKREKEQWMIAMTKYADRLLEDLKDNDYLPKIKKEQEEWIGRSEGAEIDFVVDGFEEKITVFTTRPDTVFGVTYVVLAPEHPFVSRIVSDAQRAEVAAYVASSAKKTDDERGDLSREKTGVFTGAYVVNPVNGEKVPVWVADYVLGGYGTGAVMAVPAHDERDFAFAKKYRLPVKSVIQPLFAKDSGDDAVRPDASFVKRHAAVCVIKHWSEEKYLCVKYKANTWQGFVIGGIEEGEKPEEAAAREIQEETGYKNMRFVRQLGDIVHSQFYHMVKKQNRWAEFQGVLFELTNDERDEITEDEKALADLVWVTREEVMDFVNAPDIKEIWGRALVEEPTCIVEKGFLSNSSEFDGITSQEACNKVVAFLESKNAGRKKVTYRLRDWVFSRQRYWGEPIPLVKCASGCGAEHEGWVPVPDSMLPVELPQVEKYEPTDTGESPLSTMTDWANTKCPQCGGPAVRETDTMPNWAGSSWYFLRYVDAHNDELFAKKDLLSYWLPVDLYNGGMEHATRHLLYARFWTKVLFDRGHVPYTEFAKRRIAHGLILGEDGSKMSKSKGNVVNPDDIVKEYGADTLRLYELFMGPFDEAVPWSTNGVIGVRRFLDKVLRYVDKWREAPTTDDVVPELKWIIERSIKKVSEDIEIFKFNTAIAQLMGLFNELSAELVEESSQINAGSISWATRRITRDQLQKILKLLVVFAPHVANEAWERIGGHDLLESLEWPIVDETWLIEDRVTYAVQVNGKVRGNVTLAVDAADDAIIAAAKAEENVAKHLAGQELKKVIIIPKKIVSFVV
jgi:leucyl-tRNA synthetase